MKKLLLSSFIASALTVANAATFTITVDDFNGLNTLGSGNNNLDVTKSENSLQLDFGPGSSSLGYDAFGTGTSTFGQSGEWFDGSYVKFGNSGNQQKLDFRITNNTGSDAKLKNISFDVRRQPGNSNPTGYTISYLASGDSALIKGASVATGSEMVNLAGVGSEVGTITDGINNFSEFIGANISGTAWIAAGGYANFRLIMTTGNASAASQMDNFSVTMETVVVPEPGTYALITGALVFAYILRRRARA